MKRKTSSRKAVESFFLDRAGADEYQAVREGRNQGYVFVRDFIEGVWPRCKEYLDSDVQTDAPENFHQRWWEIYVAHSLLDASVELVRRECRQPRRSGPDLLAQVAGRKLWIEAVAASPGEGPDAVRSGGVAAKGPKPWPDKEIMLRFQQAFSTKVCALAKYVEKDWVRPSDGDGYIVALNGALVERSYRCIQQFPRIVSALLLGLEKEWVEVEFDGAISRIGKVHFEYQPEVEKKSTRPVPLAAFRNPANSCVSAVLYSASDAYMERECVLVLNPHAQVPLPPGFLSAIPRYWAELHDDGFTLHVPHAGQSG